MEKSSVNLGFKQKFNKEQLADSMIDLRNTEKLMILTNLLYHSLLPLTSHRYHNTQCSIHTQNLHNGNYLTNLDVTLEIESKYILFGGIRLLSKT